jgi:eukaryotic-like serine/threonine-protein kinase
MDSLQSRSLPPDFRAPTSTKGDVLVVDDNPINLDLLSGMLSERQYRVRVATNGRRALAAARSVPPDLVMLDINMPEMDGYEVCRQLKADESTRDVPVIFISALDEAMDKVKAFESGGADYVTKPFQFEEVLARIENQLKLSRLQRDLERKNAELQRKNEELVRSREELIQSYKRADRIFSALSDVLPGTVLDEKYRLDAKIGAGGYGAVYSATHLILNRTVAVKIFRPVTGNVTPEALERFRQEGVAACRINHPNAVSILDSNIAASGIAYLVMELLEGHTLAQEIKEAGVIPVGRCADIIAPVCDLLAEAHASGMIHRDIKPDNIFLHQTKDGEVVKVVDFGLAKLLGDTEKKEGEDTPTASRLLGTPTYMSPERLNDLPYDGKTDIYSLGVTLYQMLCGRVPFQAQQGDHWAVAVMHLMKEPPPIAEFNQNISPAIEAVVMQTLRKAPAERPGPRELVRMFQEAVVSGQ